MRRLVGLLAASCCLLVTLATAAAQADKRIALVIGNARYEYNALLPNVASDAKAMEALFRAAGFDSVVVLQDRRVADLRRELLDFAERAADADVAVVYYAGHGIEVDGVNYLIPVDARLTSDLAIKDETVSLDRVLELMAPARRLRVVLLDACRENPFARTMRITRATRSVSRGLGRTEADGTNTLIAFATEPNAVADDGTGRNSPFTGALVKHLATPGLDLRIALGNVRDEVMASTGSRQRPYVTSSLGGGIVSLVAAAAPAAARPKPAATPAGSDVDALDVTLVCQMVAGNTSLDVLEAMRTAYRGTLITACIEARMAELRRGPQLALAAPSAPVQAPAASSSAPPATSLTLVEERGLRPKDIFKECADCPEMVVVPAGRFLMGTPDATRSDEAPQHQVTFARPFAAGRFEVTFAEWDACVDAGGCSHRPRDEGWGRGRRPVIDVSWNDVTEQYLPWLARVTGRPYRLLSEAEWEYAARAGTTTDYSTGRRITTSEANFNGSDARGTYRRRTVEVDTFQANAFGLHVVHGNVYEWVQDCWNPGYNGAPADGSAWTSGNCASHVFRGGAWAEVSTWLRSAWRNKEASSHRAPYAGFRVARGLGQ